MFRYLKSLGTPGLYNGLLTLLLQMAQRARGAGVRQRHTVGDTFQLGAHRGHARVTRRKRTSPKRIALNLTLTITQETNAPK